VFKQAVPLIRDERLKEDVLGFIGQEAVHADAHDGAAAHLEAAGLPVRPFVAQSGSSPPSSTTRRSSASGCSTRPWSAWVPTR
jgi:hypothetical protein